MRINQLSPVNLTSGKDAPLVRTGERRVSDLSQQQPSHPLSQPTSAEAAEWQEEEYNEELIQTSLAQANKSLAAQNRVVERSVHEVTKTVMYTVKDTRTQEVIAEFPPKRIQDMIAKMWELAGLFVDEKA